MKQQKLVLDVDDFPSYMLTAGHIFLEKFPNRKKLASIREFTLHVFALFQKELKQCYVGRLKEDVYKLVSFPFHR